MLGVEVAILVAVVWPGARIVADRRFREMFPGVAAGIGASVVAWIAAMGMVAVLLPAALHALAPLALVLLVAGAIRARVGFGRRRGLPPGSLSISASVRGLANRRHYLEQAELHGPIFKAAQFHRGMICVVGLERGHRLLRKHAAAISPAPLPLSKDVSGGFLRYMDESTYRRYGPLIRAAQARPIVADSERAMAAAAERGLRSMAAARNGDDGAGIEPGPGLERIVHDCFLATLFGLEPANPAYERFNSAYEPVRAQAIARPMGPAARAALPELREILREELERRQAAAGGPDPRNSLEELRRTDPSMPDDVCLDNLVLTLRIASGNETSLLHWLLEMLGRHPAWGERARRQLLEPQRAAEGPDLLERIVLETLRMNQSEYLYRRLDETVVFDGFRLPRGWLLRICVWESHRSADSFDAPERFDPDRFLDDEIGAARYSPFGRGEHACNGIPLVKSISHAVLSRMLLGFEWRVDGSGSPEHAFRHWEHWRPSSGLRLALTPRPDPAADQAADERGVYAGSP